MRPVGADIPVLHTGTINGHAVRFFRSPLTGPDYPWHAQADLLEAIGFPPADRLVLIADWRSYRPELGRLVRVGRRSVRIVSHLAAVVLFNWLRQSDCPRPAEWDAFWFELGEAFIAQMWGLSSAEFHVVNEIAMHRHDGVSGNA